MSKLFVFFFKPHNGNIIQVNEAAGCFPFWKAFLCVVGYLAHGQVYRDDDPERYLYWTTFAWCGFIANRKQ